MLYAGSANQVIYEGQDFVIDWFLDTQGQVLNTLDLTLHFSTSTLELAEANKGNSLFSLWVQGPDVFNDQGAVTLIAGVPGGFAGEKVPVFRTEFRARRTGNAQITMNPSSVVLRNDGQATPDQLMFKVLNFPIVSHDLRTIVIVSPTHPREDQWYHDRTVRLSFQPQTGGEYSHSFSSNIDALPDDQVDQIPNEFVFNNLPDGIYYFKVNSKLASSLPAGGWQEAGVYRVQIDATAPEAFTPVIATDPQSFGGRPFMSFTSIDKMSGISHNRVQIGLFDQWHDVTVPYVVLKKPLVGDDVRIQAIDRAGNTRLEHVPYRGYLSTFAFSILMSVLVILISGGIIAWKRKTK